MKSIIEYITEKFKINSKTALHKKDINDEVNYDNTIFSKKEVETIIEYAQSFKVVPTTLSNKVFWNKSLYTEKDIIYIYFNDNWNKEDQKNYLILQKSENEYWDKYCINDEINFFNGNNHFKDIESACKGFIEQLPDDFYNKFKK